jgi:hypothetical protein
MRRGEPIERGSTPALLLYALALRRGDEVRTFDVIPQPES